MKSAEDLCVKYEARVNKFRTRPMTEDEIIIRTWSQVCETLQERSFADDVDLKTKKCMRLASRQIRIGLAIGEKRKIREDNTELLKKASACAYSVASEHLEGLVMDADEMARLISGGHALKRRLNACRIRLVHAVMVIGNNIQELIEKEPHYEQ